MKSRATATTPLAEIARYARSALKSGRTCATAKAMATRCRLTLVGTTSPRAYSFVGRMFTRWTLCCSAGVWNFGLEREYCNLDYMHKEWPYSPAEMKAIEVSLPMINFERGGLWAFLRIKFTLYGFVLFCDFCCVGAVLSGPPSRQCGRQCGARCRMQFPMMRDCCRSARI